MSDHLQILLVQFRTCLFNGELNIRFYSRRGRRRTCCIYPEEKTKTMFSYIRKTEDYFFNFYFVKSWSVNRKEININSKSFVNALQNRAEFRNFNNRICKLHRIIQQLIFYPLIVLNHREPSAWLASIASGCLLVIIFNPAVKSSKNRHCRNPLNGNDQKR